MSASECLAMKPDAEEMLSAEECFARAGFYRLLAGAFGEEPGAPYLDALRSHASLAAMAELGVSFDDDFLAMELNDLVELLACEYTALFAASGGFPPVESVRRQGGYQQTAHTEVSAFYREHGFEVASGRFPIFEDQLGVELQFAAALLERMGAALQAGEMASVRSNEKALKRFWALHLGLWVRGYAQLIERAAEHSFFREMAKLLRLFAEAEIEAMGLKVTDEDGGRYRAPKPEMPEGGCGGRR